MNAHLPTPTIQPTNPITSLSGRGDEAGEGWRVSRVFLLRRRATTAYQLSSAHKDHQASRA